MSSSEQLSYFKNADEISSIMGLTGNIRKTIDENFRNSYDSFNDNDIITNINLRKNCQSRINVKFENREQLQNATNLISEIVDEANEKVIDIVADKMTHHTSDNIADYRVKVEILTTDSNGKLNGFEPIGTASNPSIDKTTNSLDYPIHALKITVTNKPNLN